MAKRTPDDLELRAKEIWKAPYSCIVAREDEGLFSAKVLEFYGCFADGDSREEALANLEDAALGWIQDQLEKGEPIPTPQPEPEYSGRFLLRFQRSVHARAARQAALENVSLNHFIASAVAEKLAATTSLDSAAHPSPTLHVEHLTTNIAVFADVFGNMSQPMHWERIGDTTQNLPQAQGMLVTTNG